MLLEAHSPCRPFDLGVYNHLCQDLDCQTGFEHDAVDVLDPV